MTTVCQWIGYCLCLRDSPIKDKELKNQQVQKQQVHPNKQTFDAVIVWKEAPQEKKVGGMAYEVILKPARADSPAKASSPPKERPLSQEVIERKLKLAEERRLSIEAEKLERVTKDKKIALAKKKVAEQNDQFAKDAEEKMRQRLSAMELNKNAQITALQDRLREHAKRVEDVRNASENYRVLLKERIEKKIEQKTENRDKQLRNILERLEEHEKHVKEVLDTSASFSKKTEEKLISKMEATLKNRESQLQSLMERLQEHEKHIQEVRQNKMNMVNLDNSTCEETS